MLVNNVALSSRWTRSRSCRTSSGYFRRQYHSYFRMTKVALLHRPVLRILRSATFVVYTGEVLAPIGGETLPS